MNRHAKSMITAMTPTTITTMWPNEAASMLDAPTITDFLQTLPDREDQQKIARANAESLDGFEQPPSEADVQAAPQLHEQS